MPGEHFEDLISQMRELFSVAIHRAFPLSPEARERWSTPDTLDWLGLGYEKETLFVQYTCGESFAGIFDALPVRNALAGEEQTRCQTLQKMLRDFSTDHDTRQALGVVAVGIAAVLLDVDRHRLPISVAPDFHVQVFDDVEDAEDPATVPRFPQGRPTLEMIGAICRTEEMMMTLMAIYQAGGTPNLMSFLKKNALALAA